MSRPISHYFIDLGILACVVSFLVMVYEIAKVYA